MIISRRISSIFFRLIFFFSVYELYCTCELCSMRLTLYHNIMQYTYKYTITHGRQGNTFISHTFCFCFFFNNQGNTFITRTLCLFFFSRTAYINFLFLLSLDSYFSEERYFLPFSTLIRPPTLLLPAPILLSHHSRSHPSLSLSLPPSSMKLGTLFFHSVATRRTAGGRWRQRQHHHRRRPVSHSQPRTRRDTAQAWARKPRR